MHNSSFPRDSAEITGHAPREYIGELASSIFGRRWETRLMTFFRSYLDVSGTVDQDPFLVMAGYVAPAEQWGKFIDKWTAILQCENISVWHMTDFNAKCGEYRGWSEERCERVYSELSEVITTHVSVGVVTAVEVDAYRKMIVGKELCRRYGANPYQCCVYTSIGHVNGWARENGISERIAYFIEYGDKGQEKIMKKTLSKVFDDAGLREKWQLETLVPLEKKSPAAIPCQAGDILAWEIRWDLAEQRAPHPREIRLSLGRLLLPSARIMVWDRQTLSGLIAP
jgi:hypothetical protein